MQGTLLYSCEEIWIMRTCGKVLQSIHLSASVKSIGPWNKRPSKHVTQNTITYLPCICLCFCFMVTIWCVYTQCTSPTISWKIPKMASLEGSFFSSEDTNCKHTHTAVSYEYITINSENAYTWVYRLFLGIQFPFMLGILKHCKYTDSCTAWTYGARLLTIKHVLHRGWLCIGRCGLLIVHV